MRLPGAIAAALLAVAGLVGSSLVHAQDEGLVHAQDQGLDPRFEAEARKRASAARGLAMPAEAAPCVLLTEEAWVAWLADLALESRDRAQVARLEGFLHALRLIPGDQSLEAALDRVAWGGSAIVYDFAHDRFVVGPGLQNRRWRALPTFVHEAVHWVEEARLGIAFDRRLAELEGEDDALLAYRSLVEGTATLATVLSLFQASDAPLSEVPDLSAAVRANAALNEFAGSGDPRFGPWLDEALVAPYADGAEFVHTLLRDMSWREFDQRVYPDPPRSMEHILHPQKYLAGEAPIRVTLPSGLDEAVGAGWSSLGDSTSGELTLRIVAGVEAAEGWGGDRYRVYRDAAGRLLAVWVIEFDAPADALEFARDFPHVARERTNRERKRSVIIADPQKVLPADHLSAILALFD